MDNPAATAVNGTQLEHIGELAYTGRYWRLTYAMCGHEQLLAPFDPDQEAQARQEVRRHYASCRECRSTPPRPEPALELVSNWLYVRDTDRPDHQWHVVLDQGILPPCSNARCGLAPASRLGWQSARAYLCGLDVHEACLRRWSEE